MRIKVVGLGTVRFKARSLAPKIIFAEVRPSLAAMSAGAKFGDNYTPGTFVSQGGGNTTQTPTYLVNEQARDENHIAATGETLRVSVRVVDEAGNAKTFSTLALPVVSVEGAPRIAGTPQPGQTLTAVSFSFPGVAPFTYEFQWQRTLQDIAGATAISYVLADTDTTKEVRVGMRATDSQGTMSAWVYSDPVSVDYAVPAFSAQPTFSASTYAQGALVTLTIGTAAPAAQISITEFALNGVDKRASLVELTPTTYTFDTTGQPAGVMTYRTTAANSAAATQSTALTASLTVGVATTPAQFAADGWSVVNKGPGGIATFNLITLPNNGSTAPTAIQYQIGGGAWVASGLLNTGSFDVSGFTNGVATDTSVRMVNSAGNGTAAVVKQVTTSDTVPPELTSVVFDTPTNALTVATSEPAKKYYLVNTSPTALTGAAIKAAVLAASPIAYGTINIGVAEVTPNFAALTTQTYYLHIASEDAAVNVEAMGEVFAFDWTGAADLVAPTLSLPTGVANGTTASTGGATTNEANGTFYTIDHTTATPANGPQVVAGSVGIAQPPRAVTTTGIQSVAGTGLTASTTYYRQYAHMDAAGNISNVVVSAGYTTAAPSAGAVEVVSSTLMITSSALGLSFNSTTDHVVSSQANRVVVLMIRGSWDTVGPPTITTCTFGGVDAAVVQGPTGGAGNSWSAIAIAIAPATGARGCSLVLSASQRAISVRAVECKNVNQTTPSEAVGSVADAADTTISFTRTTAADGALLLSTVNLSSGNLQAEIAAISGGTLLASEQTGTTGSSDHSASVAHEAVPTAGANGHGYTWITSDPAVLVWVELKAA